MILHLFIGLSLDNLNVDLDNTSPLVFSGDFRPQA